MDTKTTEQAFTITPDIDYQIEWSYYDMIATIIPTSPLDYGTTYTITISTDALSYAGYNLEEPYAFSFTTVEALLPPKLLSVMPENGSEIPFTTSQFLLLFSKPMDKYLTTAAIDIFPDITYETIWEDDTQSMLINLLEPLEPSSQYEINISTMATSEDGLAMENEYVLSYYTMP
jgi:hypothetical protein